MISAVSGAEAVVPSIAVTAAPLPDGNTTVYYTLSGTASANLLVNITITDTAGNIVRQVSLSNVQPQFGGNKYTWDGKDNSGNPVPAGSYTITVGATVVFNLGSGTYYSLIFNNIAVDNDGNIYVAVQSGYEGPGVYNIGEGGINNGIPNRVDNLHFSDPVGLDIAYVGGTRYFYITDYDGSNTTITTLNPPNSGNVITTNRPGGVAADSNGNFYVVEMDDQRVQVFDKNNNLVRTLPIGRPNFIAIDGAGKMYVTCTGNNNVEILNPDGTIDKTIGGFNNPVDIDLDRSGNIYVCDTNNHRIEVLYPDGTVKKDITVVSTNGQYVFNPFNIAFDTNDNLYFDDDLNHLVVVYAPGQATVVTQDNTPPVVTCTLSGTLQNGWYRTNVDVNLQAADNSGVQYLQYSYDNATWSSYSGPIALSNEGSTTVYWKCSDIYGNIAYGNKGVEIDKTAPSLVTEVVPPMPNGNGWYNSSVQVNFIASDAVSGMASVTPNATLGEGAGQSVTCTATDMAGNSRSTTVSGIKIDMTAPATTAALSGTTGSNGWYTGNVTVTLSASDGLSGINRTEYSTDGTIWETYTAPVTIGIAGTTTVYYRSVDNAGNAESAKTVTFKLDNTAPVSSAVLSGTAGSNGWYTGNVTMAINATDDGGPGLESTEYSTDNGTTWAPYTAPLTFSSEGARAVYYRSTDIAGNVETARDISIKIDKTMPEITGALSGEKSSSGWFNGDATLTLGYSDATSGIGSVMYSLDGARWSVYTKPVTVPIGGSHNVYFGASDQAGNQKNGSAFAYFPPATSGYVSYPTPTPTIMPSSTPTVTPTIMPPATPTVTPTPTPSPMPEVQRNGFPWWLLLVLLVVVAIAGAAYFLFFRNK